VLGYGRIMGFGKIERDVAGGLVCAGLWQDNGVWEN